MFVVQIKIVNFCSFILLILNFISSNTILIVLRMSKTNFLCVGLIDIFREFLTLNCFFLMGLLCILMLRSFQVSIHLILLLLIIVFEFIGNFWLFMIRSLGGVLGFVIDVFLLLILLWPLILIFGIDFSRTYSLTNAVLAIFLCLSFVLIF